MTTADTVRQRAIELARSGVELEDAVRDLESRCGGRRVAVVRARQQTLAWLDSEPDQRSAMRAIEYLDHLLERLPA
jgi:hypothetical protein